MANEEKAKELAFEENGTFLPRGVAIEKQCLTMANWKDKQFKEYLEKKLNEVEQCKKCSIGLFPNDVIRYNGAIEVINEITNELFKED